MQVRLRGFTTISAVSLLVLAGCSDVLDFDLRSVGDGFDTSDAAANAIADRPAPDNRGVISYPNYQVAIARRGDTVAEVAARVGLPAQDIADFNGIRQGVPLREGETLVLPRRVAEPSPATGAIGTGPIRPIGSVDVAGVAGAAIERAGSGGPRVINGAQTGEEPIRHRVEPGETAFSIARLYKVTPTALAEWNGLGPEFTVRTGQLLLIPVTASATVVASAPVTAAPGQGSPTPEPPSASRPLPVEDETPAPPPTPASPELADDRTGGGRLAMPVPGSVVRAFQKGTTDGISIAAATGTKVQAAGDGTVAAITRDTGGVPIVIIRHEGTLLTVYAGVENLTVEKGDTVKRGQAIASVRAGSPSALYFEVREGFEVVDPMTYLN